MVVPDVAPSSFPDDLSVAGDRDSSQGGCTEAARDHRSRDAADLIHVLRYAGKIDAVAELFVQRALSQTHPGAIEAGLSALHRRFCDDENGEGYEKVGSVGYAKFHYQADDDALVRDQRFASDLVQALLDDFNAKLAERQPQN